MSGCMVRIKRTAAPLPDNPHIRRLLGLLTVCLLWTEYSPWAGSERNSRDSLASPFIVVTSQSYPNVGKRRPYVNTLTVFDFQMLEKQIETSRFSEESNEFLDQDRTSIVYF